jgi:transcriptional regulator with XRE-family HTH domain
MAEALLVPYAEFAMARTRRAYNEKPTTPGTFGHFIRNERDARSWSQEEFAAAVGDGMAGSDVSNLERGRVGLPEPSRMIAIARALGRAVADLYVEAGYPEFAERAAPPRAAVSHARRQERVSSDPADAETVAIGPEGDIVALVRRLPDERKPEAVRYLEDLLPDQDEPRGAGSRGRR